MRGILTGAVAAGNALARAISLHPRKSEGFHYYPDSDSHWVNPLFVGGYDFTAPPINHERWCQAVPEFQCPQAQRPRVVLLRCDRNQPGNVHEPDWHRLAIPFATLDSSNAPLDGGKNYRLDLPQGIRRRDSGRPSSTTTRRDRCSTRLSAFPAPAASSISGRNCRRLRHHDPLFRPNPAGGRGRRELDPDRAGQGVVRDPEVLQSNRDVLRQSLAPGEVAAV